jgi:hypothetical protein
VSQKLDILTIKVEEDAEVQDPEINITIPPKSSQLPLPTVDKTPQLPLAKVTKITQTPLDDHNDITIAKSNKDHATPIDG